MSMDSRPTHISWNAGGKSGIAHYGNDENNLVMFYNRSVRNEAKSAQNGTPWFEDKIFVKIQTPGEILNIVDRPASDQDKFKYRRQWDMFIQNRLQVPEGTSIDLLFPNHPAVGENLRAMGIFTIQQCAKLSGNAIDNIGRGGQEYVNRAKDYLANADGHKEFHQLQAKIEDYEGRFRVQENTIKQLQAQLDILLQRNQGAPGASFNPPFIPNYDPQTERINANHVTNELAQEGKKRNRRRTAASVPNAPTDEQRITDPFGGMPVNNPDIMVTEGQDGA